MVTHFVNIAALAGRAVSSGELMVMRVGDDKRREVGGGDRVRFRSGNNSPQ
ncbi:MAG: hypothetical protein HC805_08715 [Alkalinema sp. RL_2_19]|nr:hypothetical protein [Alkalinema sp. RL_2_19]